MSISVKGSICNSGYRPQLYTVAGGSYVSNAVYSSGATEVNNYENETLRRNSNPLARTTGSIRKHGKNVDFSVEVALNCDLANPGFGATEELRIRVLPLSTGDPFRYGRGLPISDPLYGLPLFTEVEVVDADTGLVPGAFGALAGQLQARLLKGGDLALVSNDLGQGGIPATVTALNAGDIAGLFGGTINLLRISVRGSYRG